DGRFGRVSIGPRLGIGETMRELVGRRALVQQVDQIKGDPLAHVDGASHELSPRASLERTLLQRRLTEAAGARVHAEKSNGEGGYVRATLGSVADPTRLRQVAARRR